MSKSTTFEMVVTIAEVDFFCNELSCVVESIGCSVAHDSSAVSGRALVGLLQHLASSERNTDECLAFSFPQDRMLVEFQIENPELKSAHEGRIAVGCFWLACKFIEDRFYVSFTSASRSISDLMSESESVQRVFLALAKHTAGGRVQVVNEWQQVSTL